MKAKLNSLISELHGKLETLPDGTVLSTRTRNGKQQIYAQKKQTGERTSAQQAHNNLFRTAHQQAKTIYADSTLRQQWQTEYEQNNHTFIEHTYASLYNYIVGKISYNLKNQAKI